MQQRKISWNLIVRFLEGDVSPEEQRTMQRWIATDPEHEEFMVYMQKVWSSEVEIEEEWDVDSAWHRFQMEYGEKFLEEEVDTNHTTGKSLKIKNHSLRTANKSQDGISPMARWGSAAAAVAAILVALFMIYHPLSHQSKKSEKVAMRTIVCPNGQRIQIQFSDGSRVVLNGGSKLVMPKVFKKHKRRVKLVGKAFFSVAHNSERPFIVVTKQAKIMDIGTRFVVKAYPSGSATTVAVLEGKVNLHSKQDANRAGALITTMHKGVLHKSKINVSAIKDSSAYIGWTRGKLIFSNDAFTKVVEKLERWYGISVEVGDTNLFKRNLTAQFTSSQPLGVVLDAISLSLNMSYTRQDSIIIFHNKSKK